MQNRGWSHQELAEFSRKLGQLLEVGVALLFALQVIQRTCPKRMKQGIQTLIDQLERGEPLSSGLRKAQFPTFYSFFMLTAEQHGNYTEALSVLVQYYDQRKERRKKHQKILAYPFLVLLTCFLTFLFLVHMLIPQFVTLYGSFTLELPWMTQLLLQLSTQWKLIYLVIFILFLLITLLLYYSLKKHRLRCEKLLLFVPIVSSYTRTYLTAMIMKQMGYLLDGGVHVLQVCELFSRESHWKLLRQSFLRMKQELLNGMTLSQALQKMPFIHPLAFETIVILEQTGNLGVGLIQLSKQLEEEHNHQLELFTTLLETNTVVGAGIFVFLIMLALFLPMFDFIQHF